MECAIGISGINGLVGSSLADHAISEGIETYEVDFRKNLLPKTGDVIIMASGDPRKFWAQENPHEYYFKEINQALEIFSYCKERNRLVLISTTELNSFEVKWNSEQGLDLNKESQKFNAFTYKACKSIIELLCMDLMEDFFIARTCGIISHRATKGTIYDLLFKGKSWINPDSQIQLISDSNLARYVFDAAVKTEHIGTFNVVPTGFVYWKDLINQLAQPLLFQKDCDPTKLIVSNYKLQQLLKYEIDSCSEELKKFFQENKQIK